MPLRSGLVAFIPGMVNSDGVQAHRAICPHCHGVLTPSLTYPDGSDVFVSDVFEPDVPENDYHRGPFNATPAGCFFKQEGYFVCNDSSLSSVPRGIPPHLITFEMNHTGLTTLQSGDFSGLKVVSLKLDLNNISVILPGAFCGSVGVTRLSLEDNFIAHFSPYMFDGLDWLNVLSLKGNDINLTHVGFNKDEPLILPSLNYLNLADNPLYSLNQFVFRAFSNSPVQELSLKSCRLRYIHQGKYQFNNH